MSFQIRAYNNKSPANFVSKSLTTHSTLTGTLRDGSSLIDPVIIIQSTTIPTFNYLYIQEFGRYYYINNYVNLVNQMYELHCHVDVLMTYGYTIKQNSAIIARQETEYNMMLDDGWFQAYQNPYYRVQTFSNPTPFEDQSFVLVVAGCSNS